MVESDDFKLIISPIVQAEIEYAPDNVINFYNETIGNSEIIEITESALLLREQHGKRRDCYGNCYCWFRPGF